MKIDLKEMNSLVFLNAAIAVGNLMNNLNPDMNKVRECRDIILDLASEKQDPDVLLLMNDFLIQTKIVHVRLVCELGQHFNALGGMITHICLRPGEYNKDGLQKALDYLLGLHEVFWRAQSDLQGRWECFA